jgi:hypothetical protein
MMTRHALGIAGVSLFAIGCSSSSDTVQQSSADLSGANVSVTAHTTGMRADGRCWDSRQTFRVTYDTPNLPPGSRVSLHFGPEEGGNCSDCVPTVSHQPWSKIADAEMESTGSSTWATTVSVEDTGGRDGAWVGALDYVFHITTPTGDHWDNGGSSANGYYRSHVAQPGVDDDSGSFTGTDACDDNGPWLDVGESRVFK